MSVDRDPTDDQDQRITTLLADARSAGLFSAASWCWGDADRLLGSGHLGSFVAAPDAIGDPDQSGDLGAQPIGADARFDLASVTKPIVAVLLMRLVERGRLALGDRVGDHLDWPDSPVTRLSVRSLLTHTSGLPGPTPLFREHPTRDALVTAVGELPVGEPGHWHYSSAGFIILGLIAERAGGRDLAELVAEEICLPAGMIDTGFQPSDLGRCVATEACEWRGEVVRGQVHDENAVVLGGVAGHAGLFGTASDLGRFASALLGQQLLGAPALRAMSGVADGRPLGWWPTRHTDFMGDLVHQNSFGHTGFTGTSVVIDPTAGRWYVLLTNRVHPTREPRGFDRIRPRFHNLCAAAG